LGLFFPGKGWGKEGRSNREKRAALNRAGLLIMGRALEAD